MKCSFALSLTLCLSFPTSAGATSVLTIFAATANGTNGAIVTLEVAPGLGLNLNLIPTGSVVKKAWIDDPSRITLSFDGNLCQPMSDNQSASCSDEAGATVVHLRQIKPIDFPALPRSKSGVTLLTLVAEGETGRKLYQFKVMPIAGEPKYTTVTIVPNPEKLTPVAPVAPARLLSPTPTNTFRFWGQGSRLKSETRSNLPHPLLPLPKTYEVLLSPTPTAADSKTEVDNSQSAIINANAASNGLAVAQSRKQIVLSESAELKTHFAIALISGGKSIESAALDADVPVALLKQLIILGGQPE